MNYHQAVGDATVAETTQGNTTTNEVQTLTIDSVASGGLLTDTFKLAFPKSDGTIEFTSAIARDAAAAVVDAALEALAGIGAGEVAVVKTEEGTTIDHYAITFSGLLGNKNVELLIVNADQLARGFPLDFGASLGDIANVETTGTIILAAGFDTGFKFGIDLSQNTKIEITPPLFKPDNTAQVVVETTTGWHVESGRSSEDPRQQCHRWHLHALVRREQQQHGRWWRGDGRDRV